MFSRPDSPADRRGAPPEVFSITGAAESLSDEQSGRTRRYLMSMGVRTACVLLAIVIPGWPRWVLIAAAVLLPYVAVVAANAGRSRRTSTPPPMAAPIRPALPGAPPPGSPS